MRSVIAFALLLSLCAAAQAQNKTDARIGDILAKFDGARVIVVIKGQKVGEPANPAFFSPADYVRDLLGSECAHVRRISDLPVAVAEVTREGVKKLEKSPNVGAIIADVPMPPLLFDSVKLINATGAWSLGYSGKGETIAILDTGVDSSHPFLSGQVAEEACFSTATSTIYQLSSLCRNGLDTATIEGAGAPCDASVRGCDHGTHVAGIAAGKKTKLPDGREISGVAYDAKIIPIQVFTLFKDPRVCSVGEMPCIRTFPSDQLRALEHVQSLSSKYKIAAANMSLGGDRNEVPCDATSLLTSEINRLRGLGIATVVAAGNDGYYNAISSPACVSTAIAVGATNKDGKLAIEYSNTSSDVDFLAPGTGIISSANGQFSAKSGTSMATPHVSGAFAVLKSVAPQASVDTLEAILRSTADRVTDERTGLVLYRINVGKAAEELKKQTPLITSSPARGTVIGKPGESAVTVAGADDQRVVVAPDQNGPAAQMTTDQKVSEIARCLGANARIQPLTANQFLIEHPQGITSEHLKKLREFFGDGTRVYKDIPQPLQK